MKICGLLLLALVLLAACGRGGRAPDVVDGYEVLPDLPPLGVADVPASPPADAPVAERVAAPIELPVSPAGVGEFVPLGYELVIGVDFDAVMPFANGLAQVRIVDGPWYANHAGMIDRAGAWVVHPGRVHEFGPMGYGAFWARTREWEYEIIDPFGQVLYRLPPGYFIFNHITRYDFFYVGTQRDGRMYFAVINRYGDVLVPFSPKFFGTYSEGLISFRDNDESSPTAGLVGFVDYTGQVVITPRFLHALPFAGGVSLVTSTQLADGLRWGLIDTQGNALTEEEFINVEPFHGGLAFTQRRVQAAVGWETHIAYINSLGEEVINLGTFVDRGWPFSEGIARVAHSGTLGEVWGFVDALGAFVAQPHFADARCFANGMAGVAVRDDDGTLLWGFINTYGELAIQPQFAWVSCFTNGIAVANLNGTVLTHSDFNWVWNELGTITNHGHLYHHEVIGGQFHLIDTHGRTLAILENIDAVGPLSENMLPINRGRTTAEEGQWGFVRLGSE